MQNTFYKSTQQHNNTNDLLRQFARSHGYQFIKSLDNYESANTYLAKNKSDGNLYVIKLYLDPFEDLQCASQLFNEIQINRKLTQVKNNIFTPLIHDIIIPGFTQPISPAKQNKISPIDTINTEFSSPQVIKSIVEALSQKPAEKDYKHPNEANLRLTKMQELLKS